MRNSAVLFYMVFTAILLTPLALLVLAWRRTKHQTGIEYGDGLQPARWFGLVCCTAPILRMAFELAPVKPHETFVYVNVFLPFAALFTAIAGAVLYAINARGTERIVGPTACVAGAFFSLVLLFGGMVAP